MVWSSGPRHQSKGKATDENVRVLDADWLSLSIWGPHYAIWCSCPPCLPIPHDWSCWWLLWLEERELGWVQKNPEECCKGWFAWSKNVSEERLVPWQFVFRCIDWVFCTVLSLGVCLKYFYSFVELREWTFIFGWLDDRHDARGDFDEDKTAKAAKYKVYWLLRSVLWQIGVDVDNLMGSHSVWKCFSTWVHGNGIAKDNKDYRGRWKSNASGTDMIIFS